MSTEYPDAPVIDFATFGGQKLRTAIWHGTGEKKPLLFFNGIGANLEIAHPLGTALPDRDVITFDLPGVGGSPDPVVPYRPWWIARAAKSILLKNGYHDKVDVLGVSWGGGVAQQFAFQYKKRVDQLVLAATSPGSIMVPGDMGALTKMSSPKRYTDRAFLKKHFETLYGDERDGAAAFSQNMTAPSIRGYMYQLSAMIGWTSLPFLPFLPHNTLVLAGDRDRIVPLANARILKAMIPKARLHVFEDAGHLFILSRADDVITIMRDFLDAPSGEAATEQTDAMKVAI